MDETEKKFRKECARLDEERKHHIREMARAQAESDAKEYPLIIQKRSRLSAKERADVVSRVTARQAFAATPTEKGGA